MFEFSETERILEHEKIMELNKNFRKNQNIKKKIKMKNNKRNFLTIVSNNNECFSCVTS